MENQKERDCDSRESYGFKISELLKPLAVKKSPPSNTLHGSPPNASAPLPVPEITGRTSNLRGTFGSRAFLPENIRQLSNCQFKRRDYRRETAPPTDSVPVPAPPTGMASSALTGQEGQVQRSLVSSNAVVLANPVAKDTLLPSGSLSSTGELFKRGEICPHILGVQAWTKPPSCEAWWRPPVREASPQAGLSSEWYFEDLTDLQRKLFWGVLQKSGGPTHVDTMAWSPSRASRSKCITHHRSDSWERCSPPLI